MEKKGFAIFLFFLITVAVLTSVAGINNVTALNNRKVVIDVSHGQGPSDGNWTGNKLEAIMANFEGNLTLKGLEVVWATELNESVLADAQFLFLGSVYQSDLSDADVMVIVNWFVQGEKTIWVAGDSDYAQSPTPDLMNKVLRAIGSKIRVEPTSVEDPITNCAGAYRVRANVTNNDDSEVAGIVAGVNATKGILFHGPTVLYGFVNGVAVPLETTNIENVHWVMRTGGSGIIVDSDVITNPPRAHEAGQQGSFVMMAVEKYAGPNGDCKIIVSGENPYGGYQPMYSPEYYGYPMDGPTLVMNTVDWGLDIESEADVIDDLMNQLETELSELHDEVHTLSSDIESLRTLLYAAFGVAIVGLIIGIVAVIRK